MLPFKIRGRLADYGRLTVIAVVPHGNSGEKDITSETYCPGHAAARATIAGRWARDPRLCDGVADVEATSKAIIERLESVELAAYRKQDEADGAASKLVTVRAADVQVEPITWLWHGRIACGKTNLIAGDPDTGKTFLALDMASRVTRATPWPDDPNPYAEPRDVVVLSAEDDAADTLVPRLMGMKADLRRIHLIQHVAFDDGDRDGFLLERDLAALETLIAETQAVLCILDPIGAMLGKLDTHQNSQVRGALAPLADMAARCRVAVVCIHHLNKSYGGKALYRASGSLAFTAAARCVHLCIYDKTDEPEDAADRRRLFLPVKMNIARRPPGLSYRLTADLTVQWDATPVSTTADEAIAEDSRPGPAPDARQDAEGFLQVQLANGPMPSTDLDKAAKVAGITSATLRRAKTSLGIRPYKLGKLWCCRLPDREDAHRDSISDLEHLEHLEHLPKGECETVSQNLQGAQDAQDVQVNGGGHLADTPGGTTESAATGACASGGQDCLSRPLAPSGTIDPVTAELNGCEAGVASGRDSDSDDSDAAERQAIMAVEAQQEREA